MYYRRFRNDFYPFIYPELALFDPSGFEMVKTVFRVGEREGDRQSFTPAGGKREVRTQNKTSSLQITILMTSHFP